MEGMGAGYPTIPRHRVLGRLGSGGMGDVWLARAEGPAGFEKLVVVKTIRAGSPEMFLREARIAALLSHPNCIHVFELGEYDGGYFIIMEYLDGMSAARVVRQGLTLARPVPVPVATRIVIDAALGLEYAHTLRDVEGRPLAIVHRDVSLENLLVTFTGQTKVVDFGLAKAVGVSDIRTASGVVRGKVGYMPPEYLRGGAFEPVADLFSLGVVLYRMLAGKRPFDGETDAQILSMVLESEPPPIGTLRDDVPRALDDAIATALAKDPRDRFDSARAMRAALTAAVPDVTDADGVAAYMASLWSKDDRERVVVRRLITEQPASNSDITNMVTRVQTAATVRDKRRRRRVPWWPLPAAAVVGAAAAVLVARGHARHAHVPAEPVEMLVTDFRNDTGEPLLTGATEAMFAMALEEAPRVAAFPRAEAHRLAGKALDEAAAREVARSAGVYAIASGAIVKTAHGYEISVHAIEAATGDEIASARADAPALGGVLAATGQLAVPVRVAMGDPEAPEAQRAAIAKFTPASLEAMHDYAAARELLDNMDPIGAAAAFQHVLALDPTLDAAYAGLANSYLNEGDRDHVKSAFEQAFAHIDRMSDRQRFITRGMYYATEGEPHKALESYQQMLERFPDDRTALRQLAQTYGILDDYRQALATTQKLLQRMPGDLRARSNAAAHTIASGDFATGGKLASELAALQPQNPSHLWMVAAAAYYQGNVAEARRALEHMADLPGGSHASVFLSEIALAEGRTADALAIIDRAVPAALAAGEMFDAAVHLVARARARLARGETAAAVEALGKALATSEDTSVVFEVGRMYVEAGEIAKAQAIATRLGQRVQDLDRANAKILLAEIALHAGRPSDALPLLTAAQQIRSSWVVVYDLGRAYLEAGAYLQAHDALASCIARRGELSGFVGLVPPVYYYMGRALDGLHSPGAAESFRTYITIRQAADADLLLADARRRLTAE